MRTGRYLPLPLSLSTYIYGYSCFSKVPRTDGLSVRLPVCLSVSACIGFLLFTGCGGHEGHEGYGGRARTLRPVRPSVSVCVCVRLYGVFKPYKVLIRNLFGFI